MSSSRSVAAARARRSAPEPTQNYKSTGPVTSINSSASFTPGSSRLPPPQQQQQQQQQQDPSTGAKLTVTNAIALMSLRIGRLETFAYQYNLDKSNGELNGHEHNYGQQSSSSVDETVIQTIVARLDALEKEKRTQVQLQTQGQNQPVKQVQQLDNSHLFQQQSASLMKMTTDMKSLQEELKETKDLLLKLQSYTMDTNQKLVDIMFHDTNGNGFDIQQLEDCEEQEFCENDTTPVEILDDSDSMSQTISGNLKDIINAELANQLQ
jgi:hypothetical protein